jgi:hypothetical protein
MTNERSEHLGELQRHKEESPLDFGFTVVTLQMIFSTATIARIGNGKKKGTTCNSRVLRRRPAVAAVPHSGS